MDITGLVSYFAFFYLIKIIQLLFERVYVQVNLIFLS